MPSQSCESSRAPSPAWALRWTLGLAFLVLAAPVHAQSVCPAFPDNEIVRFETVLGDFDVMLCRGDPGVQTTIDNFLAYVDAGDYTSTGFVHRSTGPPQSFTVIQGGTFYVDAGGVMRQVPTRAPIPLEAGLPNLRGTLAMARTNEPDSATSGWFVNVIDNPQFDPSQLQPGYAVFGEVIAGLDVVDAISAQEVWGLNSGALGETPLIDYPDDGSSPLPYLVYVTDVSVVPEPGATVQAGAVLLALAGLAARRRRASR